MPHIALLLPLKSPNAYLEKAAESLQGGFLAASKVQPGALPIRVYGCADEKREIVALYQQALASGAQAVVGPLTHDGVMTLAAQGGISVPTLALNGIEGNKPSDKLYFFGLTLEGEARQVARLAAAEDLHTASIVSSDTPLSRRLVQAFGEEWKRQGGEIAVVKIFTGDTTIFADLPVDPGSMVFVAANADKARLFRPFLNAVLPVYATSQIFNGNGSSNQIVNYDLRDINFVDMPWLLQPDHPAVMVYPRPSPPLDVDMERLYALGIDAYRLLHLIANNRLGALPLDGVTGSIRLGANRQFEREAIAAQFRQGLGLTPEGFAELNAVKAPRNGARSVLPAPAPARVQ
jgi:outer membrane PBP1 activator LpoA protein